MPDAPTNQPPFDPLRPTPQEADDMMWGYLESKGPPRPDASLAYVHGRAVGINDRAGIVEDWQRDLLARARREGIKL